LEHGFVRAGVAAALTRMDDKAAAVNARMRMPPPQDS